MIQPLCVRAGTCALLLLSGLACAEELARRAWLDSRFQKLAGPGVELVSAGESSTFVAAGMQIGDVLLAVDDQPIVSAQNWSDVRNALVADRAISIVFRRASETLRAQAEFRPLPREAYAGIEVSYQQLRNDYGIRQRVIITRPTAATVPAPAVLVLQGLSCSSIEVVPDSRSNFIRTLSDLVEHSGQVVYRIEKPGMGDSEGHCSQTDFDTELSGYESAIRHLQSLPFVDPKRIVIYGSSMGSVLAPFLVNKYGLNGVISDGPYYRSWFEHMLEIERRIKAMQGHDERAINEMLVNAYIPFYYGMLVEQLSYADVIKRQSLLGEFNYHGPRHMYGRPVAFYHQLQRFNVPAAWAELRAPVRVRWGTHDWIMSEYDIDMIADTLAHNQHPDFEVHKYPELDHWYTLHTSAKHSFDGEPGRWEDNISGQIIQWVKALNSAPR